MRTLCACLLLVLALPASAEIYRYLDERGNPVFTNKPPQGVKSESIRLGPTNSLPAPAPANSDSTGQAERTAGNYSVLEIIGIPDSAALRANGGQFSFSVAMDPALQADHQLQVLLDGQPLGDAGRQTRFELSDVPRGEHSLQAQILADGAAIQHSASVSFTVQSVHIGSPALPRPQPRVNN